MQNRSLGVASLPSKKVPVQGRLVMPRLTKKTRKWSEARIPLAGSKL